MRVWVARGLVFGILAVAAYGFWQGTPQDVVDAVRRSDVDALKSALRKDPENVHTKVYAQAYTTQTDRNNYRARTGKDPWEGRYIIHDAVEFAAEPLPILDALLAGGADLNVRLNGRTLLHLAATEGDVAVATWLLDHGADIHAVVDCEDNCPERGYTPLHAGLAFRDDEMSALLLARGAPVDAAGANGRTAMHVAANRGLGGALVLARHGGDVLRKDAEGKTPYDLALVPAPGATITTGELKTFAQWFAPGGPFDTLSVKVRASGSPMSDEAARDLIETLPSTPRP
jgi:uncharacterized protein